MTNYVLDVYSLGFVGFLQQNQTDPLFSIVSFFLILPFSNKVACISLQENAYSLMSFGFEVYYTNVT